MDLEEVFVENLSLGKNIIALWVQLVAKDNRTVDLEISRPDVEDDVVRGLAFFNMMNILITWNTTFRIVNVFCSV